MHLEPLVDSENIAATELDQGRMFDAIVVGAGASGGLAAALLCEAGLDVLTLDAGWRTSFWSTPFSCLLSSTLRKIADPRVAKRLPANVIWRAERLLRVFGRFRQPVQSSCYAWPSAPELFVDDVASPYETAPGTPFDWIRARGIGGRLAVPLHGRQYLRHGARDFQPEDGFTPRWPVSAEDMDPWYGLVERRLGLTGGREASPWIPDSELAQVRELSAVERHVLEHVAEHFPRVGPIQGRYAPPMDSIGAAAASGRLRLRRGAIVARVLADAKDRVSTVEFFDRQEGRMRQAHAPLVFLGAGSLESTRILLNSGSDRFVGGIGARSNVLGAYVMDHATTKAQGVGPTSWPASGEQGVGECLHLPRFDLRDAEEDRQGRGYNVQLYVSAAANDAAYFTAVAAAEMLPRERNRVRLSDRCDAWGIPTLHIDVEHSDYEKSVVRDGADALKELAGSLGVTMFAEPGEPAPPGAAVHEVGGARMGSNPSTSVLDPFSRTWDVDGLYVIDGAAFPSQGIQNPTLTIMALTARACSNALDAPLEAGSDVRAADQRGSADAFA